MKWLVLAIALVGALAIAAGVVYFTVPAHSLPSFLGPLPHVKAHRKRRGEGALALGIVLWVVAVIVAVVGKRSARQFTTSEPPQS